MKGANENDNEHSENAEEECFDQVVQECIDFDNALEEHKYAIKKKNLCH